MASKIIVFIRMSVLLITLVIWSFIGFIFWIPLLGRTISVFSFSILHANITGNDAPYYSGALDKAVLFYIDGFRKIIESMKTHSLGGEPQMEIPTFDWTRLVIETTITIIFWGTTIFIFRFL